MSSFTVSVQNVSADSKAIVASLPGDSTATPTNPTDWTPINEFPMDGAYGEGTLRIDYAPSLNFGSIEYTGNELKVPAQMSEINSQSQSMWVTPFFQLTDIRDHQFGWQVFLRADSLKNLSKSDNVSSTFVGAQLVFERPVVKSISGNDVDEVSTQQSTVIDLSDNSKAQTLATASAEGGKNSWMVSYGSELTKVKTKDEPLPITDGVYLLLPKDASVLAGSYKTNLYWSIAATPA